MKTVLILGCWGRTEDGICTCNSVSNQILDVSIKTDQMKKVTDYLDMLKLYDKPLYNNIHTVLFNIQDRFSEINKAVFNDKCFRRMEEFCIMHAKCGLYLKLELKEDV